MEWPLIFGIVVMVGSLIVALFALYWRGTGAAPTVAGAFALFSLGAYLLLGEIVPPALPRAVAQAILLAGVAGFIVLEWRLGRRRA